MRKEQKEIDQLGPIGIIREAFKVLSTHSKMFMLSQITLILPLTTLTVLFQYATYRMLPQPDKSVGAGRIPHLLSSGVGGIDFRDSSWLNFAITSLVVIVIAGVVTCLAEAAKGLGSSVTLYAVGLHYTGQSVSFYNVFQAAIPRLWARLTITNIYEILVVYSLLLFQIVVTFGLIQLNSMAVTMLGLAGLGVVVTVGVACVGVVFKLAGAMSVLEKDYGWAAVRRVPKLLKGRVLVVICVQLLLAVPVFVSLGFSHGMRVLIVKGDASLSSRAALPILIVAQICWQTFIVQLVLLCTGVQYASFKAYHNEDLEESIYEKQTMKAGYERMAGSETDSVGKAGDSLV